MKLKNAKAAEQQWNQAVKEKILDWDKFKEKNIDFQNRVLIGMWKTLEKMESRLEKLKK